ncbi:hypothetical protein J6590_015208, partial [Homalodisca vitripennis]
MVQRSLCQITSTGSPTECNVSNPNWKIITALSSLSLAKITLQVVQQHNNNNKRASQAQWSTSKYSSHCINSDTHLNTPDATHLPAYITHPLCLFPPLSPTLGSKSHTTDVRREFGTTQGQIITSLYSYHVNLVVREGQSQVDTDTGLQTCAIILQDRDLGSKVTLLVPSTIQSSSSSSDFYSPQT